METYSMNFIKKIKENSIFSIISVIFVAWMIFLVIMSVIARRNPIFYSMNLTLTSPISYATTDYISQVPLLRYK